ncbi:hypothetical protein ACIRF8_09625 [Streptomyces sp. NPDC102406]|uniref:hypothetical protein n=1 Tax=Streptomyces sp. NPDC102406 TaxID=3366171 RepID=UPI00382F32F5
MGLEERFRGFQVHVNKAMHAFHDVVDSLANDREAVDLPVAQAINAAKVAYQADVWSSCPPPLVQAGGVVCDQLEVVYAAVRSLMQSPHEAKDENSQAYKGWARSLADLEFAYQNASSMLYVVLNE